MTYCLCLPATTGSVPVRNGLYGEGTGSILLDDLVCIGNEDSLLHCIDINDIGFHDCNHSEDAGVRCQGMYNCSYVYIVHMKLANKKMTWHSHKHAWFQVCACVY